MPASASPASDLRASLAASRVRILREELEHFTRLESVATVAGEKDEAKARVEIAKVLLTALEKI